MATTSHPGQENNSQQHQQRPQRERNYGKRAKGKPTQPDHRPTTPTQTGTKSITIVPTEAIRYRMGKQEKTVKKLESEHVIKIHKSQRVENNPNHRTQNKKGKESHWRNPGNDI